MLTASQKAQITAKVKELVKEANKRYSGEDMLVPKVVFNNRLKTTAGRARLCRINKVCKLVEFNVHLAARNFNDFMKRTVVHEVAHGVAFEYFGHLGHGAPWKRVMRDYGAEPSRCHDYDVSELTNGYTFVCGGCKTTIQAGPRVGKEIANGNPRRRRCRKCKSATFHNITNKPASQPEPVDMAAEKKQSNNTPNERQRRAGSKISKAIDIVNQMHQTHNEDSVIKQIMSVCNLKHNMARRYMKEAMQEIANS